MHDPYEQGDLFNPATIAWVLNAEQVEGLTNAIGNAAAVVIDLETTGLNEHVQPPAYPPRIVLASLTLPTVIHPDDPNPPTWVVPLSHPDSPFTTQWRPVMRLIAQAIKDSGLPICNQNLPFDLRWVHAHTGVDLSAQAVWDTRASSHMLDENETTRLKERAPATFGVERWDDHDLSKPGAAERVPLFDLGVYAARDTYWTWRLEQAHRFTLGCVAHPEELDEPLTPEERDERRLGRLATWVVMPAVGSLTAVQQRGLALDQDWVSDKRKELVEQADTTWELLVDLYPMSGERDPSFAPTSLWFREWTERAVDAGDLRVIAATPNGNPQWSKAVLKRLARDGSEVAQHLLDWRFATKRMEFLQSWEDNLAASGKVHTTYNLGRVSTGRLSSSNPNIQQVSADLRPAWIASRPDRYIAEVDLSQIELRVAAFIARVEPVIEAYQRGDDLHTLMAAALIGKPVAEVTSAERKHAKAANFGLLYGQGVEGFRDYAENNYDVILTMEEAEDTRDTFFSEWAGLSSWQIHTINTGRSTGRIVSPVGRLRRLPDLRDGNPKRVAHAENQAVNFPIQSFASDMLLMALSSIEGTLPGHDRLEGVEVVATVHDSLVIEVPADDWKRATARVMRRMLDVVHDPLPKLGVEFDLPLECEATVGTRWGTANVGIIA
jgi:DNA polymerase I